MGRPKGSKNNQKKILCQVCNKEFHISGYHNHLLSKKHRVNEATMLVNQVEDRPNIKHQDVIDHPPHYTFGKFEVIEVLEDWFPTDPILYQAGKYLARARHKGDFLGDLKKAEFYLKRKISQLEKE